MNDQASQNPTPPTDTPPAPPPNRKKAIVGCGGCAVVLAIILIAGGSCRRDPDYSAKYAARAEVKNLVVVPDSLKAKFSDCKIAARTKDGVYRVVYVPFSSQNRFGVMLPGYMLALVMELREHSEILGKAIYENPPTKADLKRWTDEIGDDWEIEPWAR